MECKIKKFIINKKGSTALLMTVLILVGILSVSLSIGEIVRNGLVMSWIQLNSVKAFFASESGLERILWEQRKNGLNLSSICQIDQCVRFSGESIAGCDADCDNADKYVTLSNGAYFRLKYSEITTTVTKVVVNSRGGFGERATERGVNRVTEIMFTK